MYLSFQLLFFLCSLFVLVTDVCNLFPVLFFILLFYVWKPNKVIKMKAGSLSCNEMLFDLIGECFTFHWKSGWIK